MNEVSGKGLNPDAFRGVHHVILKFSFQGTRKVTASRLVETNDLDAELREAAKMLTIAYGNQVVRKVEILSYSGSWAFDEWPEALGTLQDEGVPTVRGDAS